MSVPLHALQLVLDVTALRKRLECVLVCLLLHSCVDFGFWQRSPTFGPSPPFTFIHAKRKMRDESSIRTGLARPNGAPNFIHVSLVIFHVLASHPPHSHLCHARAHTHARISGASKCYNTLSIFFFFLLNGVSWLYWDTTMAVINRNLLNGCYYTIAALDVCLFVRMLPLWWRVPLCVSLQLNYGRLQLYYRGCASDSALPVLCTWHKAQTTSQALWWHHFDYPCGFIERPYQRCIECIDDMMTFGFWNLWLFSQWKCIF